MSDELLLLSRSRRIARGMGRRRWRAVAFVVLTAVVGALGGLAWARLSPLPSYLVGENHTATLTERQQAGLISADIYFCAIVGIIGVACGILAWVWFQRSSWMIIAVPLLAATAAALACWQVGMAVGPSNFAERLARAAVGDSVVVDLELRALSALLVAPFTAITPVMLLAAFWPEGRDHKGAVPQP